MPSKPPMFCPPHVAAARADAHKAEETRRGSARDRGYTTAWDRAAAGHKRRNPLCSGCQALGLVVAAELVDHVVPHKGDRERFWRRGNWQSACRWHHDVVKQKLEAMFVAGELVAADLRLDSPAAVALARALRAAASPPPP